jgi:hypothetical protein
MEVRWKSIYKGITEGIVVRGAQITKELTTCKTDTTVVYIYAAMAFRP